MFPFLLACLPRLAYISILAKPGVFTRVACFCTDVHELNLSAKMNKALYTFNLMTFNMVDRDNVVLATTFTSG